MTNQPETAELIQAAAKLDPSAWLSAEGTPVRLHPDAAAALGGLLVAIAHTDDETLNKVSLVRSAALTAARVVAASSLDAACAHCGSNDHTWDDCEAYTRLTADAYARTLNTPPSAETCAAIRDRLHSGSEPAAVSAAVAPPTDPTHGLSVQHADALWDAVAIPGPRTPTYPEQHERVCRAVRDILDELTPARDDAVAQTALRDRIADKLTAAAYECDGKCGLSERECYDAHPITFSAMAGGTAHVDGSVTAIADAVLAELPSAADWDALVREADRLRRDGKALHARAKELDTQLTALRQQVTEPTDRAAVYREAADDLATAFGDPMVKHIGALGASHLRRRAREIEAGQRRMADETATEESDGARLATLETDLADGPVRCPLCPTPLTLHTPSGARAHFTTVHPEQRITGRESGPWPLLVADETATQTPTAEPTAEDIARAHVTSLHLIGEQLATIESWFWEHLADVRDAGARQDGDQS